MKTRVFKADWLVPVLGIALVGAAYYPAKSYLAWKEEIRSAERLSGIVDHLREDCSLSRIAQGSQAAGCAATGQRLDELLSANIVALNAELGPADARARELAEACFNYMARQRSQSSPAAAHWPTGRNDLPLAPPAFAGPIVASTASGH
jgi:hypothetical protein